MRTWGLRVWRIDDPSVDTLDSLPEDSYLGHFMADADAEVRDLRRWVEGTAAAAPPSRQVYHCISGTNGNFVWKFDPLPVLERGDDNLRDVLAGYKDEGRSFFIHSIAVRFLSEGKGHVADTSDDDEGGSEAGSVGVEVSSAAGDMSVSVGSSSSEETSSEATPSSGRAATTASGGSAGSGEMTTMMMSVASSSEETSSSEATVSGWLSSTVPLLPLSPDDLSALAAREDGSFDDDGSDSAESIEEAEEIELVDPDDEDEDDEEEEEEGEGLTFVERAHREALMEALSGEG